MIIDFYKESWKIDKFKKILQKSRKCRTQVIDYGNHIMKIDETFVSLKT